NIKINDDSAYFDLVFEGKEIVDLKLGITGLMNVENAVAACAIALHSGVSEDKLGAALLSFNGINRRFDLQFKSDKIVYIDDYAHHPEEIRALIRSARSVYPGRKITGIFQPHLYSRTRDFADGFAESLSLLDEVILLDIYPAREKPIEGVTSTLIFEKIKNANKQLCLKTEIPAALANRPLDVLLTIGAGDIDQLVGPITHWLAEQNLKTI
ncbi:MAG: cyanophycin synthetase, partial [Bacteroidales bacterium]